MPQPGDLDTVVDITTGGAKRPENQVADQAEKFPGVAPSAGYGLTETNSMVAYIGQTDFVQNPSSAGRAVPPVTQIEALDEDGKVLPRGTEGRNLYPQPTEFPRTILMILKPPQRRSTPMGGSGLAMWGSSIRKGISSLWTVPRILLFAVARILAV